MRTEAPAPRASGCAGVARKNQFAGRTGQSHGVGILTRIGQIDEDPADRATNDRLQLYARAAEDEKLRFGVNRLCIPRSARWPDGQTGW